jgi:hypothetical protein
MGAYSIIFVTTPAPTVLPPSRIAKFNFSLIAIGVINFTVKLITPIAMDEKLNFAIREGGRTVGAGVVTKIIE